MTIARNTAGPAVTQLQEKLKALGFYKAKIDGSFGPATFAAVRDFQQRYLVDGIVNTSTGLAISTAVEAWNSSPGLHWVPPNGIDEVVETFGLIEYKDTHDGRIEITNDWESKYIIKCDLPIVGVHMVNNNIAGVLSSVLQTIEDRGLDRLIKQFWCWTPRHKMWKPKFSLSTHAWGISVDINWATNGVGKVGDIDPGIVSAFEEAGAQWGGRWRFRDDMHFQFAVNY